MFCMHGEAISINMVEIFLVNGCHQLSMHVTLVSVAVYSDYDYWSKHFH